MEHAAGMAQYSVSNIHPLMRQVCSKANAVPSYYNGYTNKQKEIQQVVHL